MMRKASLVFLLLTTVGVLLVPTVSQAQIAVGVSIRVGPPALPVYVQPPVPAPGYIWTPGYWAYGPDGYYWVPGTWVEPPSVGVLWTPGYWGWRNGFYVWNAGFWGPHVGFYGGINYGFGYTGVGFAGGEWRGGVFNYNRSVTNVNTTIVRNTYNTTVINNNTTVINNNRTSFNGGTGGIQTRPTAAEQSAMREHHIEPTHDQVQHHEAAGRNRDMLASVNHGSPAVAASPKAGVFKGNGVVAARNASFNRGGNNNAQPNLNRGNNNNAQGNFNRPGNSNTQGFKGGNGPQGGNNMSRNTGGSPNYARGNNDYKSTNYNQNRGNYNNARENNGRPQQRNGGGQQPNKGQQQGNSRNQGHDRH
jgi:hypothetical protein